MLNYMFCIIWSAKVYVLYYQNEKSKIIICIVYNFIYMYVENAEIKIKSNNIKLINCKMMCMLDKVMF